MKKILLLIILIQYSLQDCSVPGPSRVDCGFVGINQQQCEAKNCCWVPASQNDIPWCFYPSGSDICSNFNLKSDTPGFDQQWYDGMYKNFDANIDIFGLGGVVAAPDNLTQYWYHWMRDGALTMRTYLEINDLDLTKVQTKFEHYTQWVLTVQNEADPNQIDIRVEPKFYLNNRQPYKDGWCRPQNDGPALRATSLIMFANVLLDNKQDSYVKQYLWTNGGYNGGAIKFDLDWVIKNWQQDGCDLWEEIRSADFFWNRMAYRYALDVAAKFATRMGDSSLAQTYSSVSNNIKQTLDNHYTGTFMFESLNRQKDSAVTHAFNSFEGVYPFSSGKIANTIGVFNTLFCQQNKVNQDDDSKKIPGIMYGRYQGDNYQGGNPWQLLSAALAEIFYKSSNEFLNLHEKTMMIEEKNTQSWQKLLNLQSNSNYLEISNAAKEAGDSVLYRIFTHVKNDDYRIDEQVSNKDGSQTSAKGLTWSYANILTALHYRNKQLVPRFNKISSQ